MREYEDYSYYFGTFIGIAYDLGYSLDATKECDNNEDYNIGIGIQLMPDENSQDDMNASLEGFRTCQRHGRLIKWSNHIEQMHGRENFDDPKQDKTWWTKDVGNPRDCVLMQFKDKKKLEEYDPDCSLEEEEASLRDLMVICQEGGIYFELVQKPTMRPGQIVPMQLSVSKIYDFLSDVHEFYEACKGGNQRKAKIAKSNEKVNIYEFLCYQINSDSFVHTKIYPIFHLIKLINS